MRTSGSTMTALEITLLLLLATAGGVLWWMRAQRVKLEQRYAREIAEQRAQRETELSAQVERTAALFDRMVEGIIVVGPNGKIRIANRAAGALFNFTPPATDRTVLETTRHHEVAALVARLDREPEVLNHELRLENVAETR